jgi:hypothetical protein
MPNIDDEHPLAVDSGDVYDIRYFFRINGRSEAAEFIEELDDPDLGSLTDQLMKHANHGECENPHLFKRLKSPYQHVYEFKTHGKRASRVFCMRYKGTWFLLNGCSKKDQSKGIERAAKLAEELNDWVKSGGKDRCRG